MNGGRKEVEGGIERKGEVSLLSDNNLHCVEQRTEVR